MLRAGSFNYSKGELAEELIARVDVASYNAGVKRARNMLVLKYGGLTKRFGTRFVAEAYDSGNPVKLIPFQFSLTQAYALEFGQGYMRAMASGGVVVEPALAVTAITKAQNAQVSVAYHGLNVGDQVYFADNLGMVEINGLIGTVLSTPSTGTFTVGIDTRNFSTFTGTGTGITNSAPPPPPPVVVPPPPIPPPVEPPVTYGGGGGYINFGPGGGSFNIFHHPAIP